MNTETQLALKKCLYIHDLLKISLSFLHTIELQHIKETTHDTKTIKIINDLLYEKINTRLETIFGNYLPEFKQKLQKFNACVSGSFILSTLLDKEWSDSDLDIFVPNLDMKIDYTDNFFDFNQNILRKNTVNKNHYLKSDLNIFSIKDFTLTNNKVSKLQIIEVEHTNIYEYICEMFDLDFCKSVYGIDENNKEYLKFFNINSILKMKTTVNKWISEDRYQKYTERGFTIKKR